MEILDKLCNAPVGASTLLSYADLSTCEYYRLKMAKVIKEYPGVVVRRIKTKNHYNLLIKKEY